MSTNGKREYFFEHIEINDEQIRINIGDNNGGVYYEIIKRMIDQLDIAIKIHNRGLGSSIYLKYELLHAK